MSAVWMALAVFGFAVIVAVGAGAPPAASQVTPSAASVTFTYGYDATNRRISQAASDKSWWDPTASASVSYTANNLNQYSAVGSISPNYDGNGNLASDGSFTYCYDSQSRLTGIVQGSCASPTSTVATYAYDARGRRKSKTVGSATTIYVTDADNREVLEYDGTTGAVKNWYSYARGPDDALNQMNIAAGTRETMIPDVQGSIQATLDSSTGALTKIGYQTYGENPGLSSGTFRYTARRFDPETAGSTYEPSGLYYYRARMYSPTLGRFLQPDPIGYTGGSNFYAYVNNDPLSLIDPYGTAGLVASLGITGVLGGLGSGSSVIVRNTETGAPTYLSGGVATGSVGGGAFIDNGGTITIGGNVTVGATLFGGSSPNSTIASFPQAQPNSSANAISFGKGISIGYTTANSISDLAGPAQVSQWDLGILSFQIATSTTATGQTISTYSLGPALGFGHSEYDTQTYTTNPITPAIPIPSPIGSAYASPSGGVSGSSGK